MLGAKKRYKTNEFKFYEYNECSFSNEKFDNIDYYLVNQNNLIYDKSVLKKFEKFGPEPFSKNFNTYYVKTYFSNKKKILKISC